MSAVATVIRMVAGFVSIKVVAKIIGPSGIALVGQFMNSITMMGSLGTGAIGQGVTKYIAENQNNPGEQNKIIANAIRITLFSSILVSLFVILFYRHIGIIIFDSHDHDSLVVVFAITLGLYSFNLLFISIINGFKAFRKYVVINIISSITVLITSVLLVLWLGLEGALINCIISQTIVIGITLYFIKKEEWYSSIFKVSQIDKKIIKKLGAFSLMALTTAVLTPLGQIIIRSFIADNISLDRAGLWEGINRLSSMYLAVITTSIATFYLPRLAEIKEANLLRHEVLKTAKIVLPPLAAICFLIFLGRDVLISIIFSREFTPMRDLFPMQLLGDFLKISSWLIAFLFFAKAETKKFIIAEVIGNLTLVVTSIFFVKRFGLVGATYAYAMTYFIYFMLVLYFFRNLFFHHFSRS
ncbi:MAG TPA: O-antigen translocase [Chitinophagaceae bacterium]|nr:O-antigen translocase [Chitinophagaceae bacterium]